MAKGLRVLNWLTVAGGTGLLLLSLWPGFVVGCWLVLAYPLILALGVAWLVVVFWGTRRKLASPIGARAALVAPIVVCLTYGMLRYYVPRRLAFAACQAMFERHVTATPKGRPAPLGRWLGIYRVTSTRPTIAAACISARARPAAASAPIQSATGSHTARAARARRSGPRGMACTASSATGTGSGRRTTHIKGPTNGAPGRRCADRRGRGHS